jgi:hypothetical protein
MASGRTTLILGKKERAAAKALAHEWGVSSSEAIRQAVVKVAEQEVAAYRERKIRRRVAAFERLVELSRGLDVAAELARISEERDSW